MHVAIIGGGFCGRTLAKRLLEAAQAEGKPVRITLFDARAQNATAPAFRTPFSAHVLNVVAGRMSAWEERPDDFVRWLNQQGYSYGTEDFVPRQLYGDYLDHILADLLAHPEVRWMDQRVQAVYRDGGRVRVKTATTSLHADHVVVATGMPPASSIATDLPPVWQEWLEPGFGLNDASAAATAPRLIIGSGLSMVDTVLALQERGCTRPIHVVSRHGLLPRAFQAAPNGRHDALIERIRRLPTTARAALRDARALARVFSAADVVAALREHFPQQWRTWHRAEQWRFQRHLAHYWQQLRHTLPGSVHQKFLELVSAGKVQIFQGRLCTLRRADSGWRAEWRTDHATFSSDYAHVHFATGIGGIDALRRDPLWASLLSQHIVETDGLRLGVKLPSSAFQDRRNIHVIGAVRRGELFEQTAVPELRRAVHFFVKAAFSAAADRHQSCSSQRMI